MDGMGKNTIIKCITSYKQNIAGIYINRKHVFDSNRHRQKPLQAAINIHELIIAGMKENYLDMLHLP